MAFFGLKEKGGARKLMRRNSRLDRLLVQQVFTYVAMFKIFVCSVNNFLNGM